MARKYKIEELTDVTRARLAAGETNRDWREPWSEPEAGKGSSAVKRKERMVAAGCFASADGCAKMHAKRLEIKHNELGEWVDGSGCWRNFLSGREGGVVLKCIESSSTSAGSSVEAMCEAFEVSRSGYYAWRKRQERAANDHSWQI